MPEPFNPYHTWLGISPKDQPCHYYRLLGIDLFESNLDVIDNAADRQMTHVRSYQTGENSVLSQRLLNEISAARVCLLDTKKRRAYDEQLRKKVEAALSSGSEAAEASLDPLDFVPSATLYKKSIRKNRQRSKLALVAAGLGILLAVGVVAVAIRQNANPEPEKEVAQNPPDAPEPPASPKLELKPEPNPDIDAKPAPQQAPPEPTVSEEPEVDSETEPTGKPEITPSPEAIPQPVPKPDPMPDSNEPPKGKLAAPAAAAQAKALATIREVYAADYKNKATLAGKLVQRAKETQDSVGRFVLFQEAVTVAAETFEGELAFEAIDAMAEEYEVCGSELKMEVLEKAARKARRTPEQKIVIAKAALKVIDEALDEDNFDAAKKMGKQATQLASSSKDKELSQEIAAKNKEVTATTKAYHDAKEALAALKEKPDDPGANLTAGKYFCLTKGNYAKGLPMLVLGSDAKWKSLAEMDMAGASSAGEQVKFGDAWWDAGGKDRALYWYEQALPELTGLDKRRVEKRAELVNASTPQKQKHTAKVFASGDDSFEMCINGVALVKSEKTSLTTTECRLSKGDIITVRCNDRGGNKGFCCAIVFQEREQTVAATGDWKAYQPKSEHEWFQPNNIGRVFDTVRGNSDLPEVVRKASGVAAPVIWGDGNPCYLFFVVP